MKSCVHPRETWWDVARSSLSPKASSSHPAPRPALVRLVQSFGHDPVLPGAFLLAGGVLLYQLVVTLLQPLWLPAVTDWLRAGLAWPELAVVVAVSWCLTRLQSQEARSWWLLSVAFLSYAIARTSWSIDDLFITPNHVPFPTFPDVFFLLQYPFFMSSVMTSLMTGAGRRCMRSSPASAPGHNTASSSAI